MKYMGSKARFAKDILRVMQSDKFDSYVEPFAGGMNCICETSNRIRVANDINKYLIAMWKALQSGWIPPSHITKEEYLRLKTLDGDDCLIGWAGFNCSYSGKWFGGYAGVVDTKGGVRDYIAEAYKNTMSQVEKMRGVIFLSDNYYNLEIPKGSLVYCDPPYAGTTGYKDKFDNDKFWQWVRDNSTYNKIYISEYAAPEDFECVWEKSAKSSLSANGKSGNSKESTERLFTLK